MVKFSNLTIPIVSYRSALGISILIHLLVFLILVCLINPIESPHSAEIPLVIDFVSFPGEENQQVSNHIQTADINQSFQNNVLINPALHPQNSKPETIEKEIKSINPDQIQESFAQVNPSDDLAEGIEQSNFNQPYFASVFVSPTIKFPRFDIAEPRLLLAKMPMSEKQERILEKKIAKLTEKLNKMEWSDTIINFEYRGQIFDVEVRHKPAQRATDLDELIFEITTEKDGETLSTTMRMKRLAFSNFAQLVDYWDPLVAVHDDEFEGRFHTNYAFSISRSKGIGPKFHGRVTTAAVEFKTSGESIRIASR